MDHGGELELLAPEVGSFSRGAVCVCVPCQALPSAFTIPNYVFLLWKNQEVLKLLFHESEKRSSVRRRGGKQHLGGFMCDGADCCAIAAQPGQYFFKA